jgi:hypothetical protein
MDRLKNLLSVSLMVAYWSLIVCLCHVLGVICDQGSDFLVVSESHL